MMEQIRSRLVFFVLLFAAIHISGATAQGQKLRVAYTAFASLTSILEFRAETAAEAKKLFLGKMSDNSLLQEIQKENPK